MLVTLLGMVTDVRPLQPENALRPMLVTLFGIIVFLHPTMSVFVDVSIMALQLLRESYTLLPLATFISARPLHNPYLEMIDCQLFIVYTVEKWIGIWLKGCGW